MRLAVADAATNIRHHAMRLYPTFFKALCAALLSLLCACASAPQKNASPSVKPRPNTAVFTQTLSQRKLLNIIEEQRRFLDWFARRGDIETFEALTRARKLQALWDDYFAGNPDDVEALLLYGKFKRATGSYEAAYKVFKHIDELDPNIAVVKQQLGTYEGEVGNYEFAYEHLKAAVELAPNQAVYHSQLGQLLVIYRVDFVRSGKFDQATIDAMFLNSFEKASALEPAREDYKWRYAQSFYDVGKADWQKSLRIWDELLKDAALGIEKETVNANRARVLIELYRDDEAAAILEEIKSPSLQDAKETMLAIIRKDSSGSEAKVLKKIIAEQENASRLKSAADGALDSLKKPEGGGKACDKSDLPLENKTYTY